jgi:hypothetical protein
VDCHYYPIVMMEGIIEKLLKKKLLLVVAKALDQTYEFEDLVALVMGAFASAMRWTSTQHFLQVNNMSHCFI